MCVKVKKKIRKRKKKSSIYIKHSQLVTILMQYNLKFIYVQTVLKLKANHCYN